MPAECAATAVPWRPWAASSSGRASALQAEGARFESAVVHASGSRKTVICLIRIQEKPGSTPGVPTGMWCKGERAWPGTRQTGFESLLPDHEGL